MTVALLLAQFSEQLIQNPIQLRRFSGPKSTQAPSWQLTDYETDNYLSVRFALPENWNFDGFSVANVDNVKALEIGNPFPADEYRPDIFRIFPEGTELPKDYTPYDGEAGNVMVLEEDGHEWSPEEPYLFRSRSIMSHGPVDSEMIGREDVEAIASLVRIEESR